MLWLDTPGSRAYGPLPPGCGVLFEQAANFPNSPLRNVSQLAVPIGCRTAATLANPSHVADSKLKEQAVPRIAWVEDEHATGELAEVYAEWKATHPGRDRMPEILKCFSQRPDFLRDVIAMSYRVHFTDGHLDRRTKEMIATFVSGLNRCPF